MVSRLQQKLVAVGYWSGLTVGACFLIVALGISAYRTVFLKDSARTKGTVTALIQEDGGSESGTLYSPQFHFADNAGHFHTIEGQTCSHPAEFNVGDSVLVRYWINDPDDAWIESFSQIWLMPIMFAAFAVLLLTTGFILLAYAKTRQLSLSLFDLWA